MHENGTPFFWLADTGWLLPERTGRDDVIYYLDSCQEQEYNVVLVQTVNDVPAVNAYGEKSMPDGFDFSEIDKEGVYIGRKKDAIYCFCPNDSVDCVLIATDSKSDYGHRLSTYL